MGVIRIRSSLLVGTQFSRIGTSLSQWNRRSRREEIVKSIRFLKDLITSNLLFNSVSLIFGIVTAVAGIVGVLLGSEAANR